MAQDNANEPALEEKPHASDTSEDVDSKGAATATERHNAEPAADDAVDDAAEEELDAKEDGETTGTESPTPDAATNIAPWPNANPPTQPVTNSDTDTRSEIEKQPYEFDHCTVQVAIQLLPDDGDPNSRRIVIGVRSHLDAPILRIARLHELGPLPQLVNELLGALRAELPARERAAVEARQKKKEESAKRKATITTSNASRGKKTKAALSTAPASTSRSTAAELPRPEAPVTTVPQQQMGLF